MDIKIIVVIVVIIVLFICVFIIMKDKFKGFKKEGGAGANFKDLYEFERENIIETEIIPFNRTPIRRLNDFLKPKNRYIRILRITKRGFENIVNQIMDMNDNVLAGHGNVNIYNQFVDSLNWLWEIRIKDEIEHDGLRPTDVESITEDLTFAQQSGIFTNINKVTFENVKIYRPIVIDDLVGQIPNIAQMNDVELIDEIENYVSHHQIDGFNIKYENIRFI